VLVMDLSDAMDNGEMPKAQGALSYVALRNHTLVLDYPHRTLTVSGEADATQHRGHYGTLAYPTFGKTGPHIVTATGFDVNGQAVTVQIDSLYSGTMLIYPTSVEKLGLAGYTQHAQAKHFPFTDGGVDMLEAKTDSESFAGQPLLRNAPVYFATPKVHASDGMFDGTVGDALFQGHVVTLDFSRDRVWLD